jgi:ATP-dependent metallopeptidase hflB
MSNKNVWRRFVTYLLIFLLILTGVEYLAQNFLQTTNQAVAYGTSYSQLLEGIAKDEVASIEITSYDEYQDVQGKTKDGKVFSMSVPLKSDEFLPLLTAHKVDIVQKETPKQSIWASILTSVLPLLLLMGLLFFFLNQQGGGGKISQFGKSRAKLNLDKKKVNFSDVAGADEVKEELEEIVEFLKNPKKFNAIGAKIPKGVLLYGPPGTGKTLLAKAVAGEAGVAFFTISGSDFVEMFVGVGASRVRDLFEQAKKNSPCIIFIDEIDAVGRQRGAGVGGGHDEREQTLNQLLVEMDGFEANEGIIILAATNRPDILDPALLRPGRFDRQVTVGRPDVRGREAILGVHTRKKPLTAEVDLSVIAKQTPGFTGADLANLVNEAALLAARKNRSAISQNDLEVSIERVVAGPEKKNRAKISDRELDIVSYHEAGHAIIGHLLPLCDPVHKVSIIPRGGAGGYTMSLPIEDRNYMTKKSLLQDVTMMLGGRVAEEVVLGDISTGASNDIERATKTIRQMIMRWGMSDELGTIAFGEDESQVFLGRDLGHTRNFSEAVAYSIDKEVKAIMDACYKEATDILTQNRDKLDIIANALKEREVLNADEFKGLMEGKDFETIDRESAEKQAALEALKREKETQKAPEVKDKAPEVKEVAPQAPTPVSYEKIETPNHTKEEK